MEHLKVFSNNESGFKMSGIKSNGEIWFRGKDVATILGYTNTNQALTVNVEDEDKKPLEELIGNENDGSQVGLAVYRCLDYNEKKTIFINEPGLYSLVLRSHKKEAKEFKKWVIHDVLPALRKDGTYTCIKDTVDVSKKRKIVYPQYEMMNESDLHFKVIHFLRKHYPDTVLIPGLGELQRSPSIRVDAWKKGYQGGQPDILILNRHNKYTGLALELKTPAGTGRTSDKQSIFLQTLHESGYLTLISNDYDEILVTLINYFTGVRYQCPCCKMCFKTKDTRATHLKVIHRQETI